MGLTDRFLRIKVVVEVFNLWVVEEGRSLEVNRVEVIMEVSLTVVAPPVGTKCV